MPISLTAIALRAAPFCILLTFFAATTACDSPKPSALPDCGELTAVDREAFESLLRTLDKASLLQDIDSADSQLAQAELLAIEDPDGAVDLYVNSPYPIAWWSATSLLETQGRLTETLPLYARLGESYNPLSDEAAYRLYVLGQRVEDPDAQAEGEALLEGLGLSWLGLRAGVLDLEHDLIGTIISREYFFIIITAAIRHHQSVKFNDLTLCISVIIRGAIKVGIIFKIKIPIIIKRFHISGSVI